MKPEEVGVSSVEEVSESVESTASSLKRRDVEDFDYVTLEDILGLRSKEHRAVKPKAPKKECQACHSSCQKCRGPKESDCLICNGDYQLQIEGDLKFCRPEIIAPTKTTFATTMDSIKSHLQHYTINQIILVSTLFGTILLITSVTMYLVWIKFDCNLLPLTRLKQMLRLTKISRTFNGSNANDNDKRDKNFSNKYLYDPLLEMDDKTNIQMDEKLEFHDEASDSDS